MFYTNTSLFISAGKKALYSVKIILKISVQCVVKMKFSTFKTVSTHTTAL
jgi:hypothetical protein